MKKNFFFSAALLFSAAAFSQVKTQTDSIQRVQTTVANQPTITTAPLDSTLSNILNLPQVKSALEASDKNGGFSVIGNNVIIGNNNMILVVDDKATGERYIQNLSEVKKAQRKFRMSRNILERYSIGLKASTMGLGAEFATSVGKNMTLRAGYNYMDYTTNTFGVKIDDDQFLQSTVSKDYMPTYDMEARIKQNHGHALLDIYPFRNGIFHFTGGVYLGHTKVNVSGQLVDQDGNAAQLDPNAGAWPTLNLNGHPLAVSPEGKMDAELQMGNFVKPYAGVGLGRSIPSNRFGIKFEAGLIYNGNYKILQNGKEIAQQDQVGDSFKNASTYTDLLKWWPVVSIQLIYRLK